LPVPLHPIAVGQRVEKIIFRPLLVTGCLATGKEGFRIYVRCRSHEIEKYNKIYAGLRGDVALPGRMRFTIAHELRHTYFYGFESGVPKAQVRIGSLDELLGFEAFCNRMATEFLLPTTVMNTESRKFRFLEPDELRRFVEFAGVSPETLV